MKKNRILIFTAVALISLIGATVIIVHNYKVCDHENVKNSIDSIEKKDNKTEIDNREKMKQFGDSGSKVSIDKTHRATAKKKSKTVCIYGIGMKLPVTVIESDDAKADTVKWTSYINDNDKSYLLIQCYKNRKNLKKLLKELVDEDGTVCKMNSSIRELRFGDNGIGYEADYCVDNEKQRIITVKSSEGAIAIIYNDLSSFGDIAECLIWE